MTRVPYLVFAPPVLSLLLAGVSLLRRRTLATTAFGIGIAVLAADSLLAGLALSAPSPHDATWWLSWAFVAKALVPAAWLFFGLTYSRENRTELLVRWRPALVVVAVAPLSLALGFRADLLEVLQASDDPSWWLHLSVAARALNVVLLVALVIVLMTLEQTFRAAVGTARWQLKFVILALVIVLGTAVYARSQALLFSTHQVTLYELEPAALLIGCVMLAIAHLRTGFAEARIHPSRDIVRSSLTLILVSGYLFIVGVAAQVVRQVGGSEAFRFVPLAVLAAMSLLAILLLSDRLRQRLHHFTARHFRASQHDSVQVWTRLSHGLANVRDETSLSEASVRLVSETFGVLSVSAWLRDEQQPILSLRATTGGSGNGLTAFATGLSTAGAIDGLRGYPTPFELEPVETDWAAELKHQNPSRFDNGGKRWCVPLRSGEQVVGVLVLADRVGAARYTVEELDLLACIGDHVTSVLLNLRLANEVSRGRELEAFRTMSTFFVHDLKNAASSLNLTLRNLPVHFDDPAFRTDALRAIGNAARRIDDLIARLSALRQGATFQPVQTDLRAVVDEALNSLTGLDGIDLRRDLQPVPPMLADPGQLHSVVTNLVLNARDAVGAGGHIRVGTTTAPGRAVLSVADDGCGMSPEFVADSLFKPFQSTKRDGLGIGMFQARTIVERHGGHIQVESATGRGTTFLVSFPAESTP